MSSFANNGSWWNNLDSHLIHRSKIKNRKTKRAERIVTFVMWLWSGDGLVFLSPLALSDNSPGRHRRWRARSSRRHACGRQFSLNYELDLRLQPRLGDDVVNFPEAFTLQGPPVPRDHLVTWNSRREYPRNRRASDSFLRMFHGNGNGTRDCYGLCVFNMSKLKALKYLQSNASAGPSSIWDQKNFVMLPLHSNIINFSRFS